jgi:hypothetical protein
MNLEIGKEWFAGWGTLALINAGLAQSKHRSGLVWFVLSVFLGPLATLFLVLLDDPQARARH